MTSPPRIPKGSKEGGQFMPKWAGELQERCHRLEMATGLAFGLIGPGTLQEQINKLSSRLGISTPLIIWNIAVLVAIAYLYCKAYVPGTP